MTDKVQNLSSSLSVMEELLAEKDREIDRKDELIRCKKTEVKVRAHTRAGHSEAQPLQSF